jgi:hypothetical protein
VTVGVVADHHLEDFDGILHRACHGSGDIGQKREWQDAGAAGETHGRANPYQCLVRRRAADRVSGVAAESHQSEARGDGGGRSTARTGSHAVQGVWVSGVARQNGVDGFIRAERPFGHVGLGEYDGAGFLDAFHQERVLVRNIAGQRQCAVSGLQALGLEIVLDDHRHAVERAGEAALRKSAVQFVGLLFRVGIQDHDGVDRRAVLVVGRNASEVAANQFAAGQAPGLHRVVDLGDGGLLDFEWRSLSKQGNGGEKQTTDSSNHQIIV